MKTLYYLILFIYCFAFTDSKNFEQRKQDYIVQIKKQWIDSVISESHLFGLAFKRKLVSNIFLFEVTEGNRADIKGFKKYFANKIEHTERREKVIVKYYMCSNRSSEKQTYGRWLLQPINYENEKQCWPYYGMAIQEAWSLGYTGLGINVAIVDIGVDVDHPDLKRNIDLNLSYSFVDKNYSFVYPERFRDYMETEEVTSHGTMAAGLIGAEFGNQNCSAGVAFDAKLAALKVFHPGESPVSWMFHGFALSTEHIPSAFAYKRDEIDIYSCSFNLAGKFQKASLDMKSALKEGVTKGRQGRGSIFVFSAGNRQGQIYDCNIETLASSIYTVSISSVGKNGSRPSFTIPCANTLASTYGEFKTLNGHQKLETTTHDNKCDDFIGTSASTALASGIIALTVQANPNITWRDLQHIIVLSASHERLENTGQLQKNAAGLQFDSFFGFGLMNAAEMTVKARNWTNVPPQKQKTVKEVQWQIRLPRENVIHTYLQVDPCVDEDCINNLEHVQISLSYTKQHDDLLDIVLCSPHRTCSQLLSRKENVNRKKFSRGWRIWNFTSVHFWGENPAGNWKIVFNISHDINHKQLEVKNLALTLLGTSSHPFYNVTDKRIKDKTDFTDSDYDHHEDLIDDEEEIVETANESFIFHLTLIKAFILFLYSIALCAYAISYLRNRRNQI